MPARTLKEFNDEVRFAIDSAVFGLMGQGVLSSLYRHLKDQYDITPEKVPSRLDILFETLERIFGEAGARTIGKAIARRFYFRMGLKFMEAENLRLQDYLELAKKELGL